MHFPILEQTLRSNAEYKNTLNAIHGSINTNSVVPDQLTPFFIYAIWKDLITDVVIITPDEAQASKLFSQIKVWANDSDLILVFPESDSLTYERTKPEPSVTQNRLQLLSSLTETPNSPKLIIASVSSLQQKTLGKKLFIELTHNLNIASKLSMTDQIERLLDAGYLSTPTVNSPGCFNKRGGILDLFSPQNEIPHRIEFYGNNVDNIRSFDSETQMSVNSIDNITVCPANETLLFAANDESKINLLDDLNFSNCKESIRARFTNEINSIKNKLQFDEINFYSTILCDGYLLDYINPNSKIIFYRPSEIQEQVKNLESHYSELRQLKIDRGEIPLNFPDLHHRWQDISEFIKQEFSLNSISPWEKADSIKNNLKPNVFTIGFMNSNKDLPILIKKYFNQNKQILALTSSPTRFAEILQEHNIDSKIHASENSLNKIDEVSIIPTQNITLNEGFILPPNIVVLSDYEIFGSTKQIRAAPKRISRNKEFLDELIPNNYVVHIDHGVGKFLGVGKSDSDNSGAEYLIIEYAEGDKLYVPTEHVERVTQYLAPFATPPNLTRLGSQQWANAKAKVAEATSILAVELLETYASREIAKGHQYQLDSKWQLELEDSFPFKETDDQIKAIEDVKSDMESKRPMDRLICGDVGYGKTEIAVRAAFKTVMENKQVVILVPTTVLAQQHYKTFSDRLSPYPISVDIISRLRSPSDQKTILTKLHAGQIDICIGTHRIIQEDVKFKNLGLVIIDEEQRFGVAHKEKLKKFRSEVEVLTLTATPIPRTLNLALSGIRDMSIIESAPEYRTPVKTFVAEFNEQLIREAILREIDRKGQVFFVHNRVQSIDQIAHDIKQFVPECSVLVAHGQMPPNELEKAMLKFAGGEIDVLVCTTIIESGIDIPNANSIIINRADSFGLSQLYQLRGRVGRSTKRAYAYLLTPPRMISPVSETRLKTIISANELGIGFKLAMKDLEIRGAGSILGAEQSGHMKSVGYDLYNRILSDAVETLRAKNIQSEDKDIDKHKSNPNFPANIQLHLPSNIPDDYIEDLQSRMKIYKRIESHTNIEELAEIKHEMRDRFGPLPIQLENLLSVKILKIYCGKLMINAITQNENKITLFFTYDLEAAKIPIKNLLGNNFHIGNKQIIFSVKSNVNLFNLIEKTLRQLLELIHDLETKSATDSVMQS